MTKIGQTSMTVRLAEHFAVWLALKLVIVFLG